MAECETAVQAQPGSRRVGDRQTPFIGEDQNMTLRTL